MATREQGGIRFQGKLYSNWPDLRAALSAAGINPSEWVGKNKNKAQALGVGLAAGGKVVRTNEQGVPLGEARAQAAADQEEADDFFAWVRTALSNHGVSVSDAMISRLRAAGVTIDDPNALIVAFQQDPEVDNFFPGFTDLVNQGFIGVGPNGLSQYRNFKRQMNDTFERFEGRRMTDDEFLANVTTGVSTGLLQEFFQFRHSVTDTFQRHAGRAPTAEEINDLFRTGKTPDRIEAEFRGRSIVAAERGDVQQVTGAFAGGQLSEAELTAFGEQRAGLSSQLGEDVLRRVQQAQVRMRRIFEGQVARGELALPSSRSRQGSRVDVGA